MLWALREKPAVKVDEYALEHLLLYHGLIGSSPDNQREWKDVKADILQAIQTKSAQALAITLKLPPLWWQDKLVKIFDQFTEGQCSDAVALLLTDSEDIDQNNRTPNPLTHEDWRVRANAAHILGFLKIDKAAAKLGALLDDTTDSGKLAFCHVAYALGKLRSEKGIAFLSKHITNEDGWCRVDAVGALAHYPYHSVASILAEALLREHELKDYMAVAVAKHHQPRLFFTVKVALPTAAAKGKATANTSLKAWVAEHPNYSELSDERIKDAGSALILGLIDAAEHTFSHEVIVETQVPECLEALIELATTKQKPIAIAAAVSLINWLSNNREVSPVGSAPSLGRGTPCEAVALSTPSASLIEQLQVKKEKLTSQAIQDSILAYLEQNLPNEKTLPPESLLQLRQSIYLAGLLQIEAAEPLLAALLLPESNLLDEIIAALGAIAKKSSLSALINLADQIINRDERNSRTKSKQPVVEDDAKKATTYWDILKALANFPDKQAALFLLQATQDFAPDKRAQAVTSLSEVLAKMGTSLPVTDLDKVIGDALSDQSSLVQLAALSAAVMLHKGALIAKISRLLDAQENAVSKHALTALFELSNNGYKNEVSQLLQQRSKKERQEHKKKQIDDFLAQQSAS